MTQPTPVIPDAPVSPESRYAANVAKPTPGPTLGVNEAPEPGFLDLVGASWRREHTLGAALAHLDGPGRPEAQPEFNPFAFAKANEQEYGDVLPHLLAGEFDFTFSPDEFETRAAFIRRQMQDKETIANGGFTGAAVGLGVGLLDPINLLPLGNVRGATRLGNAARTGLGLAGATAVQEAALQAMDPTRDASEAVANIGGAAVLGGALGSLIPATRMPQSKWHPAHAENPLRADNPELDTVVVRKPGEAPEEGLKFGPDSIGAARVTREGLKWAKSDNEFLAALQSVTEKAFDHWSPLARMGSLPSDVAREVKAKLMDLGGRLTRDMLGGKAVTSAEALNALDRQVLRGYQDRMTDHYRAANMDLGQSGFRTTLGELGNSFRPIVGNTGDFNRVAWQDFQNYVVQLQAARMVAARSGATHLLTDAKAQLAKALESKGFTPEQIKAIDSRAEAAAKDLREFQDRYKQAAIREGLMDPASDLGDGYGFAMLYQKGAIDANPGVFRAMLVKKLATTPPDEFLAGFAARRMKPAAEGETPKAMTLDELKEDRQAMADAMLEWRGDFEQAMATGAAANLSDLTTRVNRVLAEMEVMQYGTRAVEKEKRLTTVAQAKAAVAERMARHFRGRIERAANNVAASTHRQEQLSEALTELVALREARETADSLAVTATAPGRLVNREADLADALDAKADAKRGVDAAADARKAAQTDLASVKRMIETLDNQVGQEARYQLALLRKQAEGIEARLVPEALADMSVMDELARWAGIQTDAREVLKMTRDLEALAKGELRTASELAAKSRRHFDNLKAEFGAASRRVRASTKHVEAINAKADRIAAERGKDLRMMDDLADHADDVWQDMEKLLGEATAARRRAVEEWKVMRKANAMSRAELKKLLRSQRKAKALQKRVEKGTPMEVYIDELVDALRGGEKFPEGVLMDTLPESGRLKERKLDWNLDELNELLAGGYIEGDLMKLMQRYQRDLGGRVNVQRTLGTQNFEDLRKAITDDYDAMRKRHQDAGNHKAAEELVRLRDKDLADVQLLWDRATGKHRAGAESDAAGMWAANQVRNLTYLAQAGGFVFSAVQDTATAMLTTSGFLPGLVKHAGAYRKMLERARAGDPDAKELRLLLSSLESSTHLAGEGNLLGELHRHGELGFGDPKTRAWSTKVDAGLRTMGDRVGQLTGLSGWSDTVRRTAARVQLENLSRMVREPEHMKPADRANLASLGIGDAELKRLGELMRKHGRKTADGFDPGLSKWRLEDDGDHYADVLGMALTLTQRRASYVPGYGSVPLLMNKWYGAMLLQFQSYGFQFVHSFLLAGSQRALAAGDKRFLAAAATTLATTVMVSQMRAFLRGEDTTEWSNAKWANEIVSRSGAMGQWSPYVDAGIKLVGNPINEALGVEVFAASSKYRNNNALGSLVGPWFNYGNTVFNAAGAAFEGDFEGATDKARRLAPMNQQMQLFKAIAGLKDWKP